MNPNLEKTVKLIKKITSVLKCTKYVQTQLNPDTFERINNTFNSVEKIVIWKRFIGIPI